MFFLNDEPGFRQSIAIEPVKKGSMMSVSIIIPTFRESQNLDPLLREIHTALSQEPYQYEVIIVDDNSRDGSEEIACRVAKELGISLKFFVRIEERGLATAVLFGMSQACGDLLVCMDADLSHPPASIPNLVRPLLQPHPPDMVIGSRYVDGACVADDWEPARWVNSLLATWLSRPLLRHHLTDPMAGFFALPKQVFLRGAHLRPIGYKIGLELLLRCGCARVEEIPISFRDRQAGSSKLNLREVYNYLNHLSCLYDFVYPRLSSSLKYVITICFGLLASAATLPFFAHLTTSTSISVVLAYSGALAASVLFFARYIRHNHNALQSVRPVREFLAMSLVEYTGVIGLAITIAAARPELSSHALLGIIVAAGAAIRFLLRKLYGHDLRGPSLLRTAYDHFVCSSPHTSCLACGQQEFRFPYLHRHPWLVECTNCHFMFAHPQPTDDELSALYGDSYFDEWGNKTHEASLAKMKRQSFRRFVDPIAVSKDISTMLDVGCGLGYTLDVAAEMGWEAAGIDLNPAAVERVSQRFPGRVFLGECSDVDFGKTFDLISCLDVIEHVRQPVETLRRLAQWMDNESLLLLTTIDLGSFRARRLRGRWFHIHRAHLWYFSKSSLRSICESAGLEVVLLAASRKHYTGRYICGILSAKCPQWWIKFLATLSLRILPSFILDASLPPLRDGLKVVARRATPTQQNVVRVSGTKVTTGR